jgi:hypothetical protein
MELQAFLSWFSRNRLLPEQLRDRRQPMAQDFIGTA